ncbi:unnamed protein product [Vicia faba]|uniref:RRM domain-containing protein n=1 Tax=Vicia faba TaxID=3906 RepID=A0AAV1AUU1_VICFA|nr:unnamed protein product [Vicia faba]
MQTSTVQVKQLSDLATEREIYEFFSFSGEIENIQIVREYGKPKTAFVTFKDPKALEIALLLSGATIVDQIVSISPVENYVANREMQEARVGEHAITIAPSEDAALNSEEEKPGGRVYLSKAQDVVTNMLAKGSAIKQDAVNKAKAFDEKHQLTANASAKRLHVSDKTMAAIFAAERKLNDTGSAVKTSRYVTAGTSWLTGAFSKVAKAGNVAGTKTREKFNMAVSNLTTKDTSLVV